MFAREVENGVSHSSRIIRCVPSCLAILLLAIAVRAIDAEPAPVSFSREVAPILVKQCQTCHGPEKSKSQYRLDTFERLSKPGKSKAAPIVAGSPAKSELYQLISTTDENDRMPQKADALPAAQIALIRRWIEQGAKYDAPNPATPLASIVGTTSYPDPPAVYSRPVPITAIAFSPDGRELAASGYHEITIWDPSDGKLVHRIKGLPERIWGLAYSPDGKQIAVAAGEPGISGELRLCDRDATTAGKTLERIGDMMLAVRFSPDGKRIAAGGADNAARIFDADSGKRLVLIEQHADWVTDVAFSPDGSKLATASRDRSARVFDAATGQMLAAHLNHQEAIFGIAWSDDGKEIYTVGRDPDLHVWNAADGNPVSKAEGKVFLTNSDSFKVATGDGKVFTCSADGIVREFEEGKASAMKSFPAAEDWVYCLALDPKTHHIAAGCHNGEIRIYDGDSGDLIEHFIAAP